MDVAELPTPALLVERSLLEANLARMSAALPGPRLRPHVKAHKCTALARRQADGDGMGYAKLQLLNTGLVVGFAFVVPLPDLATTSTGVVMLPFVLGYLGAQVLCALGLKFLPAWQRRSPSEVKS